MTRAKASAGRCPDCQGALGKDEGTSAFCAGCGALVPRGEWITHGRKADEADVAGGERLRKSLGPTVTCLADVERREAVWRWRGRLAAGRLTGLIGDPGVGKSWVTDAIAAAVTRGWELPGDDTGAVPADVLLLSGEDGIGDTVRPRLEDLGADLRRVHIFTGVRGLNGREEFPSLVDHLGDLERALVERRCGLLVVDPINAFLGTTLDTHRDAALRGVLSPLAALCERLGVACVFVLHLRKSGADRAIYRASGSIAYVAAARVVLLAGANPENPEKKALVWVKGNLTEPMSALAYEIKDGRFLWAGESTLTAAQVLAADSDGSESGAAGEAERFMIDALVQGARLGKEVQREAVSLGISTATLRRARERIGVQWRRIGEAGKRGGGRILWALPEEDEDLLAHSNSVSKLIGFVPEGAQMGPLGEQVNREEDLVVQGSLSKKTDDVREHCGNCGTAISILNERGVCGRCRTVPTS